MTFSDLNLSTQLLNALSDLGYEHPTTIQERAFPVVMSGKDVIGIAQTGTGKTFAYLLPALRQWKYAKDGLPQILVIVPTRELVIQVVEAAQKLTTYMSNVVVSGVYGGVNMRTQAAEMPASVDVLVATPGRLMDLVLGGYVPLRSVKKLVIDEVDEMLNLGFRSQLINILDLLPPKRQNLLFSATMTEEVEALMDEFFNFPVKIEAAPAGTPLQNIFQIAYQVPNFYTKVNLVKHLLKNNPDMTKVLLFTASKRLADLVFEQLNPDFPEQLGIIHSNKSQNQRFAAVKDFFDGKTRVLIATDLVARGIDISEVSHVINFDTPDEAESYIHRIGRTGRADKQGSAVTFFTPADEEEKAQIEQLMQYVIPIVPLPEDLAISAILIEEERPVVRQKNILVKPKKLDEAGPAFHEKAAKNSKVNNKVRHSEKMREKYGKPKKKQNSKGKPF